jgi:hypothetical protein
MIILDFWTTMKISIASQVSIFWISASAEYQAKTSAEASSFINKLLAYHDTASLGSWRNQLTFIADDEDFNLHLRDAEIITGAGSNHQ